MTGILYEAAMMFYVSYVDNKCVLTLFYSCQSLVLPLARVDLDRSQTSDQNQRVFERRLIYANVFFYDLTRFSSLELAQNCDMKRPREYVNKFGG